MTPAWSLNPHPQVIFLSPPWGGPGYLSAPEFRLRTMKIAGRDGLELFHRGQCVAPHLIYFLPRNTPLAELAVLRSPMEGGPSPTQGASPGREEVYVERHHLNGKLKTVAAYFGPMFQLERDFFGE